MATLARARGAQSHAVQLLLQDYPEVSGVGLTKHGRAWALKVNLTRKPRRPLPEQVDGVPIVPEIVGKVVAQ